MAFLRFLRGIYLRKEDGLVTGAYALFALYTLIRGELPDRWHAQLYFYRDIRRWELATIGLSMLIVLTLWGAFREWARHERIINKRRESTDAITRLLGRDADGRQLRDDIRNSNTVWHPHFETMARAWEEDTAAVIRENAPLHTGSFYNDVPKSAQQFQPGGAHAKVSNWANFMDRRLDNLDGIVRELRAGLD